jgi:hypothetical protein
MLQDACNLVTGAQWCENRYFKGWGHDCVNMIEAKKQNKVLSRGELSSCHHHLWLKCQIVPGGITLILPNLHIASFHKNCSMLDPWLDNYNHMININYMININTGSYCLNFLWCTKNLTLPASSLSFVITTFLSLCVHTVALLSIKCVLCGLLVWIG